MSAMPRIIEGTWDEVLKHANELAGHRLRVTVLADSSAAELEQKRRDDAEAEQWVRNLYAWAHDRSPVPTVWDDSRESIYADRLDRQL